MAGQKFSQRDTTVDKAGGFIPINLPIGGGEYVTKMISVNNLLAGIGNNGITILGITSTYGYGINANSYIGSFKIKILTGTPSIKIGTTAGGTDIVDDGSGNPVLITSPTDQIFINRIFPTAGGLNITVSGGTIDLNFDLIENLWT